MMNLNLSNEATETRTLRAEIRTAERKLRLLDAIAGTLISGLLAAVVVVLPMLAH